MPPRSSISPKAFVFPKLSDKTALQYLTVRHKPLLHAMDQTEYIVHETTNGHFVTDKNHIPLFHRARLSATAAPKDIMCPAFPFVPLQCRRSLPPTCNTIVPAPHHVQQKRQPPDRIPRRFPASPPDAADVFVGYCSLVHHFERIAWFFLRVSFF